MAISKVKTGGIEDEAVTHAKLSDTTGIKSDRFSVPSLTTTQRNALSGVAAGDLIYNSTSGAIQQRRASDWVDLQPVPSISSVVHNTAGSSYAAVGDTIKVVGKNFGKSGASVKLGTTACTSVSQSIETELTCVVPSVSNASFDVVLTNSEGLTVTKTNGITISASPSWGSNAGDTTMEYTQGTTVTNGAGTEGTSSYQAELFLATSATTTVTQALSGVPSAISSKIELVQHSTPANGYYLRTVAGQSLPSVTSNTTYSFNIVATEVSEGQQASLAVTLTVLANFFGFGGDN